MTTISALSGVTETFGEFKVIEVIKPDAGKVHAQIMKSEGVISIKGKEHKINRYGVGFVYGATTDKRMNYIMADQLEAVKAVMMKAEKRISELVAIDNA